MALMLRQACQPLLDERGFTSIHADIDDSTKNLVLYSPCRKQMGFVHGVVFASTRPTNAEIEYAVQLFTDWLNRNESSLDDYLLANAQALETRNYFNKRWKIEGYSVSFVTKQKNYNSPKYQCVAIHHPTRNIEWGLNTAGELMYFEAYLCRDPQSGTSYAGAINLPKKVRTFAIEKLKKLVDANLAKARAEELGAILNSCVS